MQLRPDSWSITTAGNTPVRCVDVNVGIGGPSREGKIVLKSVPAPLEYHDVCERLRAAGPTILLKELAVPDTQRPDALLILPEEYQLTVRESPSKFIPCIGGSINLDEPLIHFYNTVFLAAVQPPDSDAGDASGHREEISETTIEPDGCSVNVGGVEINFRRTVRVPDNAKTHALPPDMGAFTVYNSADYLSRLPLQIVEKGGAFIAMYQREAMWINFTNSRSLANDYAVKVSVGSINALTGRPQDEPTQKQDYLAVKNAGGQQWLDGISMAPGLVKQFVAMPLGQGYTVEGQITGKEAVGGLQIDIFPAFLRTVEFHNGTVNLNLYKTPRELGIALGAKLRMSDKRDKNLKWRILGINQPIEHVSAPVIDMIVYPNYQFGGMVKVRIGARQLRTAPFPEQNDVGALRAQLRDAVSGSRISVAQRWNMLKFNGKRLEDGKRLSDYNILPGSILTLPLQVAMRPRPLQFSAATTSASPQLFVGSVSGNFGVTPGGLPDQPATTMFSAPAPQSIAATTLGASKSLSTEPSGWTPRSRAQVQQQAAQLQMHAAQAVSGLAAGGTIAQKIVRDTLPPIAYDLSRGVRLHVAILNAPQFPLITGLLVPASPVSSQTYLAMNLPWFELWEEHVPVAGNALPGSGNLLGDVESVAEMDRERKTSGDGRAQRECGYCAYEMATVVLTPCGHAFCDGCLAGVSAHVCPACRGAVVGRVQVAAAMPVAGNEEWTGVQAGSNDPRIMHLKQYAGTGRVGSFRCVGDGVSALYA
ncbi:hypothetical protein CERSUDRAFT_113076 [Gelatoporia subvermispora B]|uniref:RING-type domain-containing protein n=1 Tax=Ceriporiopsis subvermispora (strain B) TaxID=914234 RepID=M2RLU9_CERS8|nr:hypothetical protein CERSUDRAFT_113076 [Gelatoporia subvermispora B]